MRLNIFNLFRSRRDVTVPDEVALDPRLAQYPQRFKDPKWNEFLTHVPPYERGRKYEVGEVVKLRNNTACLIELKADGNPGLTFLPHNMVDFDQWLQTVDMRRTHQLFMTAKWPDQKDPRFKEKLQDLLVGLGMQPTGKDKIDPRACYKDSGSVILKYYQRIVSTYIIYGPYRGVLINHSMGSGKTLSAISAIDNFIAFNKIEHDTKQVAHQMDATTRLPLSGKALREGPNCFVVLPPKASLEQNFRSELVKLPSRIHDQIVQALVGKTDAQATANRIINRSVTILSYVSIANRLRSNKLTLENSLIILDEAHNFLEPPPQFRAAYKYLSERIRKTQSCKIMLMTGTPIYKSVVDLTRLLNLLKRDTDRQFPDTEDDFFQKYFSPGADGRPHIDRQKFTSDIQGYISTYDAEGDLSLFAKKVTMQPIITSTTPDHFGKWAESKRKENVRYGLGEHVSVDELVVSKNPKFKNKVSGYYKSSSQTDNTPLSFRTHGKWPAKFHALADRLESNSKEKAFVYSRHVAQGANAIGEYLEKERGWVRMSNNTQDHGTNSPKQFSPLSRELAELKTKKLSPEAFLAAKRSIVDRYLKKGSRGFVVVNKATTQREITYAKDLFNDTDFNVDGRLCLAFIADESFSEGLSLLNTLHVHLLDPTYTLQAFKQVVARAVRNCSHRQLKWPWTVKIWRYLATGNEGQPMTDADLMAYSDASQHVLQQVIDCVAQASIESGFKHIHASVKPKFSLWKKFMMLFAKRKPSTPPVGTLV